MDDDDDDNIPPPTPAVQFYAPTQAFLNGDFQPRPFPPVGALKHQDQHGPPTGEMTSESSSSSLSSMNTSFATHGSTTSMYPSVHAAHQYVPHGQKMNQRHEHYAKQQLDSLQRSMSGGSIGSHQSPISPAALIGQGQENLMLPPARQGQSPQLQPHSDYLSMSEQQQRHLAWLRDLNAMAKAATHQQQSVVQASPSTQFSLQPNALLPDGMMLPPGFIVPTINKDPPVETAEKRAKRLERNRESARKSRRRKKERLFTLEAQVNQLHGRIEAERRTQINAMVSKLGKCRLSEITRVVADKQDTTCDTDEGLVFAMEATGPSSELVRGVQDFQYNSLKELVLPRYHKLLLWLTIQPESFFIAGKEEYNNRMARLNRSIQPKVSSKQIGDELTNGEKIEDDGDDTRTAGPKRVTFQDTKKDSKAAPKPTPKENLTTYANDAARVWPLLCYELSLSVDQEEKFVALHKKVQDEESLPPTRSQITAAVTTSDSLRDATESLSRLIGLREQRSLVHIMAPAQVLAYRTWLASNQDRCQEVLAQRETTATLSIDVSLRDICRRLNDVLKVSISEK